MSRVHQKKKQVQKKISLCSTADYSNIQNIHKQGLIDVSISTTNKPKIKDHNQSLKLLEQFKIKYYQLHKAYQLQCSSLSQLIQYKKKMQNQINKHNHEFCQKEIKRLRIELQKLQSLNQDHKYKLLISQNRQKQLQNTLKHKNDELKKSIQLLQKQKITSIQCKNNLYDKQIFFQNIIYQIQNSNKMLADNYQQSNNKIFKIQLTLKNKNKQYQTLQQYCDQLTKKIYETQKNMKSNKQNQQLINQKNYQIIGDLQAQLRHLTSTSKQTIQLLQSQLTQIKTQTRTDNLPLDQLPSNQKPNLKQQGQIFRLEQINKQLTLELNAKSKLLQQLQEKLIASHSQQQYQQLQKQLSNASASTTQLTQIYQQKLITSQKQLDNIKLSSFRNPGLQPWVNLSFQQLLKLQLQQNSNIKKQLQVKIDEIYNLQTDIDDLKSKLSEKQNEVSILTKKLKTQQKNYKIQTDILSQNSQNEITTLKRKLSTLQSKVQQKTKQVKQKQNFIINTIIGRSKQQDVPFILSQISRIFQNDYHTLLNAALSKLQAYQQCQ